MAEGKWQTICRIVQRKRVFNSEQFESGGLRRCLNCLDLTALGVGSTLGIGIYVLVGAVAQKMAGPSILLSFLIAALASLFAALCYAEMGARVPLAGTAYIYTYVTVGELVAFVVGWNNILEFVFGSASVARGLSAYVDSLTNYSMSSWYQTSMPLTAPLLSPHFDLFSFVFVVAVGCLLALGVRESSLVNKVFTVTNLFVIVFVVVAGSFKANTSNWSIPIEQVPSGYGEGGFFPYGVWGTLKGAAVCFYGFVGFDIVNSSGEEVKNPQRTIPTAILSVLLIVFASYAGVSIVVTMMVPYYQMSSIAAVSTAFSHVGWEWARWIIVVGAVFGISTSLLGAIFPLPRLLYSMASDGLFIHWFARVSAKQSPVIATVIPAILIAILSAILELEQLVLMMCIGTLSSYTIVAICVVLLRYRSNQVPEANVGIMTQMMGCGNRIPTRKTKQIINVALLLYVCLCITIAIVSVYTHRPLIAIVPLHLLAIITVIIIALQPTCDEKLSFKTPFVPFLPCLSIYANIHLLVIINWHTWLRVLIWMVIGTPIYFICICCYKQNSEKKINGNEIIKAHSNINGKPITVQIVVEAPTPPGTVMQHNNIDNKLNMSVMSTKMLQKSDTNNNEQKLTQQMQVENNEEKEAKIIDLLDQVLQAEEDSYGEIISLKENKEENTDTDTDKDAKEDNIPHRKSLSELSDAESDASLTNQGLSKYDVVAQVHREDLHKVSEEDEKENYLEDIHDDEDEEITAFNESETNSRTDESGYSDTIDRQILSESIEDTNMSNIPVPPPFIENYFKSTSVLPNFKKYNTMPSKHFKADLHAEDNNISQLGEEETNTTNIPVPPPLDEDYFKSTPDILNLKKYNTISSNHSKVDLDTEDNDVNEPRISLQSNASHSEGNIRFGSARQIKFMSKLNDIFQKTIDNEDEEPRKRSQSTGNVVEPEIDMTSRERPQLFLDLKRELLSRESLPNLRPVDAEEEANPNESDSAESEGEDNSMNREDLKSKLESIFAVGGPQHLAKPRLMKSNPPTPEESYQTDQSSTESIPRPPKMEKNDTLKRQKEKFGKVLNSIKLSMNKDDEV